MPAARAAGRPAGTGLGTYGSGGCTAPRAPPADKSGASCGRVSQEESRIIEALLRLSLAHLLQAAESRLLAVLQKFGLPNCAAATPGGRNFVIMPLQTNAP